MMLGLSECTGGSPLAVVPVFVNAGAALLPALVSGAASVVALLLRPREFLAVARRQCEPHGLDLRLTGSRARDAGEQPGNRHGAVVHLHFL